MSKKENTINIRPTVGYLGVLSRINYTPYHAMAEFVDNSVQSYVDNKAKLKKLHNNYKLKIEILVSNSSIEIKDNAAGIDEKNYERAFQAAMRPKKTSGLSEFGMGMKTAACWFSNLWSVKSKAIGEDFATEAKFDVEKITEELNERLIFKKVKMPKNTHYTVVVLKDLIQKINGRAVESVRDHLSSIYRLYLEKGEIEIKYNGKSLKYKRFNILKAPNYQDIEDKVLNPKKILWKKKINFEYNFNCEHKKHKITGFVAICDPGSSKTAGLAIFRRSRLIAGSHDKALQDDIIIRQKGSQISRRLFGELYFDDDMEVTHTKDNLNWSADDEDGFWRKLKSIINSDDMPLIRQADKFKKNLNTLEAQKSLENAGNETMLQLSKAFSAVEKKRETILVKIPKTLPKPTSQPIIRTKKIPFRGSIWSVNLILNKDKLIENKNWLEYSLDKKGKNKKKLQIQVLMHKGFSTKYFGNDDRDIEGKLLLLCYIVLAEIISRQNGFKETYMIRDYLNKIIDTVPPTIN
jgi:hypothetical protein